jgi:hypothetical protein
VQELLLIFGGAWSIVRLQKALESGKVFDILLMLLRSLATALSTSPGRGGRKLFTLVTVIDILLLNLLAILSGQLRKVQLEVGFLAHKARCSHGLDLAALLFTGLKLVASGEATSSVKFCDINFVRRLGHGASIV